MLNRRQINKKTYSFIQQNENNIEMFSVNKTKKRYPINNDNYIVCLDIRD